MGKFGLILTVLAALTTAVSNLMLRSGVTKAGGFGISDKGLVGDMLNLLKEPLFVAGIVFYGVAALIWFRILSTEDLSTGYVLLVAITFLMVTSGNVLFFEETVSAMKIIGIVVILGGIVIVTKA